MIVAALLCGCLIWQPDQDPSVTDQGFHHLIYEAEVYGHTDQSLEKLRGFLGEATSLAQRQAIIEAMSVVKKSASTKIEVPQDQTAQGLFLQTQAVILQPPFAYFYNQGSWWELGDWVDEKRIVAMNFTQITLEDTSGEQSVFPLPRLGAEEPGKTSSGSKLLQVPVSEVLAFATRKEKLNFFLPSSINDSITGFFPEDTWQRLIDRLCTQTGLIWTRRPGSIVYERSQHQNNLGTMIRGIDTRDRRLGSLLQEIADMVSLELVVFDEDLRDITIDLYLADQPWAEALDCLSLVAGFSWAMVPQANGSGQLVVTNNRP